MRPAGGPQLGAAMPIRTFEAVVAMIAAFLE
jgi:hypothetical protein